MERTHRLHEAVCPFLHHMLLIFDNILRLHAFGQLRGHALQLLLLPLAQGGTQGHGICGLLPFQRLQELLHAPGAGGSPGPVLDIRHPAVLQRMGSQIVQQVLHGDEHTAVIGLSLIHI